MGSFHAICQFQKIEKRTFGLLDTIFYLNGSDTTSIETFHPNGNLAKREWKNDSIERFNFHGKRVFHTQTHIKHQFGYHFNDISNNHEHQKKLYYPDGRLLEILQWQGDTALSINSFQQNGKIFKSETWHKRKDKNGKYHEFYYSLSQDNQIRKSEKHDTLSKIGIDSVFQEGHLAQRKMTDLKTGTVIEYFDYHKSGKIEDQWKIDSNSLHPDKDNGDCIYGFRNMRGDWAIPPQYDNVKPLINSCFIVNKNEKYGIIDEFGKNVLPLEYDFLAALEDSNFPDFSHFVKPDQYFRNAIIPLRYRMGDKYGIMEHNGKVLLPPQYDDVRQMKGDSFEVKNGQKWGLVDSRGRIIVQPKYYRVDFTSLPNIFIVSDTFTLPDAPVFSEILGLINDKNEVLLDPKFSRLQQDYNNPEFFNIARKSSKYLDNLSFDGVFHLKKGWIFDTSYNIQHNTGIYDYLKRDPVFTDSIIVEKSGYVNRNYDIVLPFEYDFMELVTKKTYDAGKCKDVDISTCHSTQEFFICKKDKKFGIYGKTANKWLIPLKYDYIEAFEHSFSDDNYSNAYQNDVRFLALKDGKWRWIDENDNPLSDDIMDYAGKKSYHEALFTIKDNKISLHNRDFFPNNIPLEKEFRTDYDHKPITDLIKMEDFTKGELLVNPKGFLTVPPQYNIVAQHGTYAVVKDEKGNQLLIGEKGDKRPFLQQYKIELPQIADNIVIVQDSIKKLYGAVTPEGKVVLPLVYHAITELSENGILWAKTKLTLDDANKEDNEKIESRLEWLNGIKEKSSGYTLTTHDDHWLMFNKTGQQLTQTVFAFPINIQKGHGIGVIRQSSDGKQRKMGLWRADGKNILPPQYDHIFFDDYNRLYFIYKKEVLGMKVGICDTTGRILIEPKFDRMGVFNGNYALVQEDGKLGLIMRNGQLKIPPQYNGFKKTTENIAALLYQYADSIEDKTDERFSIPYGFTPLTVGRYEEADGFDTLDQESARVLKNFVTEKIAEGEFIDGEFVPLDRPTLHVFGNKNEGMSRYYGRLGLTSTVYNLLHIQGTKKHLSFILGDDENRSPRSCGNRSYNYKAYNYIQNEIGEWNEVHLEDLLNLTADNSFKINQLIINKIKDLKDADIDCSNSATYFEQVKDKCYLYPEGIKFFLSHNWWYIDRTDRSVQVLLTWEELKKFIKK
jgi:WG containing repeat